MRFEVGPSVRIQAAGAQASVAAEPQMRALRAEGRRRRLELPPEFDAPDHDLWMRGYQAEARRATGLTALRLDDALTVVRPFLDPLLDGSATGIWNPERRAWLRSA